MLVQRLLNAHCKGSGLHNDPVTTLTAQLCGSYNQARTVCLILLIRALRLAWNPKELKHTYTHIYTTQHTQTQTYTHARTHARARAHRNDVPKSIIYILSRNKLVEIPQVCTTNGRTHKYSYSSHTLLRKKE